MRADCHVRGRDALQFNQSPVEFCRPEVRQSEINIAADNLVLITRPRVEEAIYIC